MISEFLKVRNKIPVSDLEMNKSVKINKKDHSDESKDPNKKIKCFGKIKNEEPKNKSTCLWKFDSFLFIIFLVNLFLFKK